MATITVAPHAPVNSGDLVVHVVVRPRRRYDIFGVRWDHLSTKLPVFLDSWQEARVMCGRRVKAILPVALDDTDATPAHAAFGKYAPGRTPRLPGGKPPTSAT